MVSQATNIGFKVWAVDNVVYGSVELPELVRWVKDERVTSATWVYSEKDDRWAKAEEVPELQLFFHRKAAPKAVSAVAGGIPPATLRRVKIFADMSDADLARFLTFMEVQDVQQWSAIVNQGEPGDAMFLVLEGEVRVRLMIENRETTLVTLSAGDFFGEVSLFDQGPRSADVIANTHAVLLKISHDAFSNLSKVAPELAAPVLLSIGKTLTGRIRADNKRYRESLMFGRAAA